MNYYITNCIIITVHLCVHYIYIYCPCVVVFLVSFSLAQALVLLTDLLMNAVEAEEEAAGS